LFKRKRNWIDFDAGRLLGEEPADKVGKDLFQFIIKVASGEIRTKNEINGYREIAIFKDGVTL
jgi:altronate hydrolase